MLTKAQAHKIIKAATDGDATRALLTLVDLLTDPSSPEFNEEPRVSESWTLERVKALTPSRLLFNLRSYGLLPVLNDTLDWNMAMGAHQIALLREGEFAVDEAWDDIAPSTSLPELTPEQIARVALWAVVMPK